ncbi:hypothetical protein [Microbacterium timonense]|uniref:hypothetical protein n=1 Tax=Microbacterium timonense TaxID=2086576 RepID=UPI000D0FB875|nr:hypothetical protein [Microbacterium timonense]
MSINNSTERPTWAVDTEETEDDVFIYYGPLFEEVGMTAQIMGDSLSVSTPQIEVKLGVGSTREHFSVPVTQVDDLITLLSRVRGSVAIRPHSGEIVGLR